ncbi:MAG: hypothetical protein IPK82_19970 [Polyangiaceae bacterium]|nr:hypothetical protein [Polyangiaceae bacterium]
MIDDLTILSIIGTGEADPGGDVCRRLTARARGAGYDFDLAIGHIA